MEKLPWAAPTLRCFPRKALVRRFKVGERPKRRLLLLWNCSFPWHGRVLWNGACTVGDPLSLDGTRLAKRKNFLRYCCDSTIIRNCDHYALVR
jgi:hypothetical protein